MLTWEQGRKYNFLPWAPDTDGTALESAYIANQRIYQCYQPIFYEVIFYQIASIILVIAAPAISRSWVEHSTTCSTGTNEIQEHLMT